MSDKALISMGILWTCAILAGTSAVVAYDFIPASALEGTQQWPGDAPIDHAADKNTLLLFVHPKCPCTRATVAEFERLLPQINDQVSIYAIVYVPAEENAAREWEAESMVRRLENTPGVTTVFDSGGRDARTFGATTSGEVFLYTAGGTLSFQGGITAGRGHEGGNPGIDLLHARVDNPALSFTAIPVFGCSLFSDAE